MPDISMCQPGGRCRDKEKCYRFMARANGNHQSYACFAPGSGRTTSTKECPHWWEIAEEKKEDEEGGFKSVEF